MIDSKNMEGCILKGTSGREYALGTKLGSGGEGCVYSLTDGMAAKVYHKSKASYLPALEKKIACMLNIHVSWRLADGRAIIAWPLEALYEDTSFVGYIMPRVEGAWPFYVFKRSSADNEKAVPNWSWRVAVTVAANLAVAVSILHSSGVTFGDMNTENILVYPDGKCALIDTDSFEVANPVSGERHRCVVGMPQYVAPELQGMTLSNPSCPGFTRQTDEFALAVHIFELLMTNRHPFNLLIQDDNLVSSSVLKLEANIMTGRCPHVRNIPGCTIPLDSPVIQKILPNYIIDDFRSTFDYCLDPTAPSYRSACGSIAQKRTSAAKWAIDLKCLLMEPGLVQCDSNPHHWYLAEFGSCELCAAESKKPKQPKIKPKPDKVLRASDFLAYIHGNGDSGKILSDGVLQRRWSAPNFDDVKQNIVFSDDGKSVEFLCFNYISVSSRNRIAAIEGCNEVNKRFKWGQFFVDEDLDVICYITTFFDQSTFLKDCNEISRIQIGNMDEAFPIIMSYIK